MSSKIDVGQALEALTGKVDFAGSDQIARWMINPEEFVWDVIHPPMISSQQKDALHEYGLLLRARYKRSESLKPGSRVILNEQELEYAQKYGLSIESGQGTGKDAFCAWCIWHFLCCFEMPLIMCTAPTAQQLEVILWAECFKWFYQTELPHDFKHQSDKIFLKQHQGKKWLATWKTINTKASEQEQAVTLAGLHEENMLYVCDEASGIPDPVFRPIEGSMTQKNNLALVIYNPTKNHGYAFDTQRRDRKNWVCLHWSSEESELVTKDHINRMRDKYGRGSNMYRIRILGLPPKKEENTLIDFEWVMNATDRRTDIDLDYWKRCAGLDVAGGGGAKTILVYGVGNQIEAIEECFETRSKEIAYWYYDKILQYKIEEYSLDTNGMGLNVAHILEDLGCKPIFCDAGTSARDEDRFVRLRDELWWDCRIEFEENRVCMPYNDDMVAQLTCVKYDDYKGAGNKIKIMSKADMRKEGNPSPDEADALCIYYYCRKQAGRRNPFNRRPMSRPIQDWRDV